MKLIEKAARPANVTATPITNTVRDRFGAISANEMATSTRPSDTMQPSVSGPLPLSQMPTPGGLPPAPTETRVPLRWQFPYGYNQTITPRSKSLTPFATLRQLAEVQDIIRICIETRKDQICSLEWDVIPKDPSEAKRRSGGKDKEIQRLVNFWKKPDRLRSFTSWLRLAVEEILVVDALSIYKRRTYGGDLYGLEIKDGTTFLPLLTPEGDTPLPPTPAFRQIIYGAPVCDLTAEELIYAPRTVRAQTPYGMSPTEAVLLAVNAALQREIFNLSYYSDGNVPEGIMSAPESWTPDQIKEAQAIWDMTLAGNAAARRKIRIVGNKMAESFKRFVDPDFSTKYDEWLLKLICAAFGVPPSEIGFTNDVNKATGKSQENIVYRRGVKPLAKFLQDLFTDVMETDLNAGDFKFIFTGGESEDILKQSQSDKIKLEMGVIDIDTWRANEGEPPVGLGPFIMSPNGPILIETIKQQAEMQKQLAAEGKLVIGANAPGNVPLPPSEQNPAQQQKADLKKFRTVVMKSVKAGRSIKKFESSVVPATMIDTITKLLSGPDVTPAMVDDVFTTVAKMDLRDE